MTNKSYVKTTLSLLLIACLLLSACARSVNTELGAEKISELSRSAGFIAAEVEKKRRIYCRNGSKIWNVESCLSL